MELELDGKSSNDRAQRQTGKVDLNAFADPNAQSLLLHSIREQLKALSQQTLSDSGRRTKLCSSFSEAMSLVLDARPVEHRVLVKAFEGMYKHALLSMAEAKIDEALLTHDYISPTGFIMSPLTCTHTIKDVCRVQSFVRGIDNAIAEKVKNRSTVRILYPACGPFAPLLLPLLRYYKSQAKYESKQIKVTLVDIQPGAILAIKQLVSDLEVADYIELIEEADATRFEPEHGYDLILVEAMQHGFSKEGHLSIAKHLVNYLNLDGCIIPQELVFHASMVVGETEFQKQWLDADFAHSDFACSQAHQDRVPLGEIFRVNKSTLLRQEPIQLPSGIEVVEGQLITLPKDVDDMSQRVLTIHTQLQVYGDHDLGEYDSGITHPKTDLDFYFDLKPNSLQDHYVVVEGGDSVKFYYQLTGLPGFTMLAMEPGS